MYYRGRCHTRRRRRAVECVALTALRVQEEEEEEKAVDFTTPTPKLLMMATVGALWFPTERPRCRACRAAIVHPTSVVQTNLALQERVDVHVAKRVEETGDSAHRESTPRTNDQVRAGTHSLRTGRRV